MSDLIERMEKYLNTIPDDMRYTSPNDFVRMLDESLTALRGMEGEYARGWDDGWQSTPVHDALIREVDEKNKRIAELENKNAQYAKMCVRNDEWLCSRDQEIQRLDAALKKISLGVVAPMDFARKARAGDD